MLGEVSVRQFEIIDAAGRILTTSGVSGLTIKNLAKEMQFSEGAIYRHFASKEDIVVAMLQFLAHTMDERFTAVIKPEQSPEKKLKSIFATQFTFFEENPHFVVAVFSDGLMEENIRINQTIGKIMEVKIKHLRPVIMEGQLEGIFKDTISTNDMVHIVMGTFRLLMYKWRVADFGFDLRKSGNNMMNSLWTLIKAN